MFTSFLEKLINGVLESHLPSWISALKQPDISARTGLSPSTVQLLLEIAMALAAWYAKGHGITLPAFVE